MKKYAKIINEKTKECEVGLGTNIEFYKSQNFTELNVEQAYNGQWYLVGYVPVEPEKNYVEKRLAMYPSIGDQLDMIYHDKVDGTSVWQETICAIKTKYPKE